MKHGPDMAARVAPPRSPEHDYRRSSTGATSETHESIDFRRSSTAGTFDESRTADTAMTEAATPPFRLVTQSLSADSGGVPNHLVVRVDGRLLLDAGLVVVDGAARAAGASRRGGRGGGLLVAAFARLPRRPVAVRLALFGHETTVDDRVRPALPFEACAPDRRVDCVGQAQAAVGGALQGRGRQDAHDRLLRRPGGSRARRQRGHPPRGPRGPAQDEPRRRGRTRRAARVSDAVAARATT